MPPEVLSVVQARAAGLGKGYPDTVDGNAQLESRILAEEQRLKRYASLNPLTGERVTRIEGARIWLPRPVLAASLSIVDAGAATVDPSTYLQLPGGELVLISGDEWPASRDAAYLVTWEPDDLDLVRNVLIELLRITLSDTGMQSETIRGYSYSRGGVTRTSGTAQRRLDVIAPLLPHDGIGV